MKNENRKTNKTKFVALFVLIAMLATSISLVGCEFDIGKTEGSSTTSSSNTTTDENPPVEELVFEHGDNFTEDDIAFVRSLHGANYSMSDDRISFTFDSIVDYTKNRNCYLYYCEFDVDNPYYICAYIDFDIKENAMFWMVQIVDITKFSWYKFDDLNSIPETIGELEKAYSYVLYSCTLIRDVGNKAECNHKAFYYERFNSSGHQLNKYTLMFYHSNISDVEFFERFDNEVTMYELYLNEENKCYLKFRRNFVKADGTLISDDAQSVLGQYYDILLPHFEELYELEESYVSSDGEERIAKYIGIDILTLENIIFE